MRPHSIAKKLIRAWETEGDSALAAQDLGGGRLTQAIDESLAEGCLQEVLTKALEYGMDPLAAGFINREAEKKAGVLYLQDPKQQGRAGAGCFLLAIPCSGNAIELNHWLQDTENQKNLEKAIQTHLITVTGLNESDLDRLNMLPQLIPPALIAQLTAESRRTLLIDLLDGEESSLKDALLQHSLPATAPDEDAPVHLTEGMLMLAIASKTSRGHEQSRSFDTNNQAENLALGRLDLDFLEQAEAIWDQQTERIGAPQTAQISQPVSVNEALMETLHAGLMTLRFNMIPQTVLEEVAAAGESIRLPEVERLSITPTDQRSIQMEIHSEYGTMVAEISADWAMVEGEEAFQQALASSMELDRDFSQWHDLDEEGPSESLEDIEGDHPAWSRAMPAPKGMN